MTHSLRCKAIIFDCDGLLLDTERLNNKAVKNVLVKYGLSEDLYTDQVRQHVVGVSELEGAANAVREMSIDIEPEVFFEEKEAFVRGWYANCKPMKGAKELVLKVLESGIPCGLATSANKNAFELKVDLRIGILFSSNSFTSFLTVEESPGLGGQDPSCDDGVPAPPWPRQATA